MREHKSNIARLLSEKSGAGIELLTSIMTEYDAGILESAQEQMEKDCRAMCKICDGEDQFYKREAVVGEFYWEHFPEYNSPITITSTKCLASPIRKVSNG